MLLKHQPWHRPEDANLAWVEVEWNMWTTRQRPHHDLELGDLLLTVTGGGPRKGRIMNQVKVTSLIKGHYRSHREAWRLIESGIDPDLLDQAGVTRESFLRHPYTINAPTEGWLLAFGSHPELAIDQPRPEGLRFRPSGWAEMDDDDLDYLLEGAIVIDDDDPKWILM